MILRHFTVIISNRSATFGRSPRDELPLYFPGSTVSGYLRRGGLYITSLSIDAARFSTVYVPCVRRKWARCSGTRGTSIRLNSVRSFAGAEAKPFAIDIITRRVGRTCFSYYGVGGKTFVAVLRFARAGNRRVAARGKYRRTRATKTAWSAVFTVYSVFELASRTMRTFRACG